MRIYLDQKGAVSLISVVIFITIITVVVTAYLTGALAQQRTAVNYDMGTRAYYTAESGIQDAARALQSDITLASKQQACTPLIGGDSKGRLGRASDQTIDYGLTYTCQIIDTTPSEIKGEAIPNKSTAMFKLDPKVSPGGPSYKLLIKWSPSKTTINNVPALSTLIPRENQPQDLPPLADWQSDSGQYNAMVRFAIINHPKAQISRSTIKQNVLFLNPAKEDSAVTVTKDSHVTQDETLSNAACVYPSSNTEFLCQKTVQLSGYDFVNDSVYIRIGALYKSTSFELQLIGQDGKPAALANAQATIDVTGKAKDVYRRVRQAFPLKGGYLADEESDNALTVGEGICKLFTVTTNPNEFTSDSTCQSNP